MTSQFPTWRYRPIFLTLFCFSCQLKIWSNSHVNIITGSGNMTIFKGLTRIPEIRNNPIWVLPNIWRMGQVMDTKFGMNVSNRIIECYWMLQNARVTTLTIFELLRENQLQGLKLPSPYHTQTRVKQEVPSQRRKSAKKSLQKYLISRPNPVPVILRMDGWLLFEGI